MLERYGHSSRTTCAARVELGRQIRSSPIVRGPLVRGMEVIMLKWAAIFFVIAIVAAILGFSGVAVGAAEIAKILFFVFLLVFVVTLIMGVTRK